MLAPRPSALPQVTATLRPVRTVLIVTGADGVFGIAIVDALDQPLHPSDEAARVRIQYVAPSVALKVETRPVPIPWAADQLEPSVEYCQL